MSSPEGAQELSSGLWRFCRIAVRLSGVFTNQRVRTGVLCGTPRGVQAFSEASQTPRTRWHQARTPCGVPALSGKLKRCDPCPGSGGAAISTAFRFRFASVALRCDASLMAESRKESPGILTPRRS